MFLSLFERNRRGEDFLLPLRRLAILAERADAAFQLHFAGFQMANILLAQIHLKAHRHRAVRILRQEIAKHRDIRELLASP